MAEPLAELVGTLFDDKATTATLRSHKLGLETLYTILKEGVENDHDKLGLTNTQIQSVVSVAYAIVSLTRSVTVEQVEPIVVAIMEKSLEFIIRCLESSVVEDDMDLLLLEIALVDGTIKEADVSHPSSVNLLIDSLKSISIKSDDVDLQEHIECIIQGNSCSKEKKPLDRLLMTLASEWTQNHNMNSWTIGRSSHDFNKSVPLLQYWAVVHLRSIQCIVSYCARLVENLDTYDEQIDSINLRKRLPLCSTVFKLLASVTKDTLYVEYEAEVMGSFACFTNVLPSLFRSGYEFATSNVSAEFSIKKLVLFLLEAFLHLVHTNFCNSNVFQNILVSVIVSHKNEALFGDLFSEGGRFVGSVDGFDQLVIVASFVTNVNMRLHVASELFNFLRTIVFSRKKLNTYHIDIILSVLICQGCYVGDRTSDVSDRMYVRTHEVCYEVLHNLISLNALSEEDYIVCKILTIENGFFISL
ncbi:hypothetical protein Tco_1261828 [Tanacetum coccineum]